MSEQGSMEPGTLKFVGWIEKWQEFRDSEYPEFPLFVRYDATRARRRRAGAENQDVEPSDAM